MRTRCLSRLLLVLALTAGLIGYAGPVIAQGDGESAAETYIYEGEIDDEFPAEAWGLSMGSADRIRVRVERLSGNLVPTVAIIDAAGGTIANSRGPDRTGASATIEEAEIPMPGDYEIVVGRERGEEGLTAGTYSLTVTLLAAAEDAPANAAVIGPVQYDTPVSGTISATHWLHRYTLDAPAADFILVEATRMSGTLVPRLEIRDANGQNIRTGYPTADQAAATAETTLPTAGQYEIVIYRERGYDGATVGDYELTVTLAGAGEGSPLLTTPAGEVVYNTVQASTITRGAWYEDWMFTTGAPDTLSITVQRALDTPGNTLRPEVRLIGAGGQELRRGYVDATGAQATIDHYALNATGTFTVRVMRENGQTGDTWGDYRLLVTLEGAGEGSPALAGSAGTVTLDTPVMGAVTPARWAESWSFAGTEDAHITITVERTEGTLIPRVELLDANGQSMRNAYPNPTRDSATIENYRLPGTRTYTIVVYREGDQGGYTTGAYSLTVTAAE